MSASQMSVLLELIDQGFDSTSWHGPNLRSALRGVTAKQAARRPATGRHNIWEQAIHAAYWKYVVRRRLTGEKRGSFTLAGSNWIKRPLPRMGEAEWASDLELLERTHRSLREAIADVSPTKLNVSLNGKPNGPTPARLITGIAMHDVYHAGQIGLIKRLIGVK